MKESRKSTRLLLIASVVAFIGLTAVVGGLTYLLGQQQLVSLRSDHDELRAAGVSLQDEILDLSRSLDAYHQIATHQEELAHSLRFQLNDSIGNRLVITEATYEELPKTIVEAQTQGYSLLDTIDNEGNLIEAACFAHEDARHYGKRDPKITDGIEWHGSPFLLIYNSSRKNLIGMVLESISPQPAPPWEHHAHGHPSMEFSHWSLHLWFTDPPENLSLGHHTN